MGVTVSKGNPSTDSTDSTTSTSKSDAQSNGKTPTNQKQLPPPIPPKKKKQEIFNEKDYKHVATHVSKAPEGLAKGTFRELVDYLTGTPGWDDLAKVRAIFLWLTSVDIYNMKIDTEPPKYSPMEYFKKIQNNQGNHAHLFSGLCQMANIHCMIVSGMNKSAAYQIGKKVDRKKMGAQWNAVYVQNTWRFVDSFWASACVVGRRSGEWELVDSEGNVNDSEGNVHDEVEVQEGKTEHRVNEFYFLPDPDQLIYTHFPDEKQWQLLEKPLTVAEFEKHFYVRERFHILGMKTTNESHKEAVIKAADGEVNICFALANKDSEHYRFKNMLYKSRKNEDSGSKIDMFLDRFVFFEHSPTMVNFILRFPMKGVFKMDIYGLDVRESDIFDLACTYLIECPQPRKNCLPLPDCPQIGWGPGAAAAKAGLKPLSHDTATIVTKDGKVNIELATTTGLKVELHQGLKHTAIDEATLSKYAVTEQDKDKTTVRLRLPQTGEYALKLFAQESGKKGEAPNVCNYLIKCEGVDSNGEQFPHIAGGVLGKHHLADKFGVKALSHPGGTLEAKDGKLSVNFAAKDGVELICELYTNNSSAAKTMAVATKNENGEWVFDVDVPKSGEYSLNVFARDKNEPTRIHSVHSYLLTSAGKPGFQEEDDGEGSRKTLNIPTETVETSENEAVVPIPPGCNNPRAEIYRRNANESQDSNKIGIIQDDDMQLVSVKMKDYGDYMLDIYDTDDDGNVSIVARYQLNRKRPGELYTNNLKTIMETLQEEGVKPSSELEENDDNRATKTDGVRKRQIARGIQLSKEEKRIIANRHLERALNLKDEQQLERAIARYLETNPPEDDPLLKKARNQMTVLKAKYALQEASQKRDAKALEAAIKEAKSVNKNRELNLQIALAVKLKEHLARIEKLRHAVLHMEQTTISELKSYSQPPEGLPPVMAATFILLGSKPSEVKKWRNVLVLMGKTGKESLMRKVSLFNAQNVPLSSAKSAKKALGDITMDQVHSVSSGAATFFQWATSMIEEVESFGGAEAADSKRLKQK